ncbi:MAG: amino acid ABC transporter permease [Oscillospiraceae bacterium]
MFTKIYEVIVSLYTQFYETMIVDGRWMLIVEGLGNTLLIALCAIIIGTFIGCVLALFKLSKNIVLRAIATTYTTIIRGIPLATQLMIFYFVIFAKVGWDSRIVAIIGFGINSGAYVAEIFRAGIQGVDLGQSEAGRSLGLNKRQTMTKIVLPQAIKAVLPTYTSEFIALIKETSIVSFITVMDLTKASDMIRNATYDPWTPLFTAAVIYLALTYGLTKLFAVLERRLARSDRG